MSYYGNFINESTLINEGKFLNKLKKVFSKKKENTQKEFKPFCSEDEYAKIEPIIKKAFNEYGKIINKVLKDNKVSYAKFIPYDSDTKESICEFGVADIFYFDIFEYANIQKLNAREITYEDLHNDGGFFKLVDEIKSKLPNIEGIRFNEMVDGMDWDDYISEIVISKSLLK